MCRHVRAFIASATEAFRLRGPVYRFGSGWVERSRRESLLPGHLAESGCIDVELSDTAEVGRFPLPDGAAQTVLCLGALECSFEPRRVLEEMTRILRSGGALLICAPNGTPASGPMPGHWRLTPHSVERLLRGMAATMVGWQGPDALPHTIYGIGFKAPLDGAVIEGTRCFLERFQARVRGSAAPITWPRRLKQLLLRLTQTRAQRRQLRDHHKLQFIVHFCVDQNLKHNLLHGCLSDEHTGSRLDIGNDE